MTHFYDDYKMLDSTLGECTSQLSLREVCYVGGEILDGEKTQDTKMKVKFLGCIRITLRSTGLGPGQAPERRKQLLEEVGAYLSEEGSILKPKDAGRLRSKGHFAGAARAGKVTRGCESARICVQSVKIPPVVCFAVRETRCASSSTSSSMGLAAGSSWAPGERHPHLHRCLVEDWQASRPRLRGELAACGAAEGRLRGRPGQPPQGVVTAGDADWAD